MDFEEIIAHLPEPYYREADIAIYCGDCRSILPLIPDKSIDLVLTDPPYGIGWMPRVNNRDGLWLDKERPNLTPFMVGGHHCFWGGNYFTDQLPISESWLLWLKRPEGFEGDPRTYATCEMAWTDYGGKPHVKTHVWDGGKREGDKLNRDFCHPAQKPIEIILWCITLAPNNPQVILDPFLGSGTTAYCAKKLGRACIGIEIEEKYCEIAKKRLSQSVMRLE